MNVKPSRHISTIKGSPGQVLPRAGFPAQSPWFSFRSLLATVMVLPFLSGSILNANEFDLAEYYQPGKLGAAFTYDIADKNGHRLGTIQEEVVGETSGSRETVGHSTFHPTEEDEYTATFSYRHLKDAAGIFHLARFEANTYRNQENIVATRLELEAPEGGIGTLSFGESLTVSAQFTMEQSTGSNSEARSGTISTTWNFQGFEQVTVPAGSFTAARLEIVQEFAFDGSSSAPELHRETTWVAPGIGILRREFQQTTAGVPAIHELTAYQAPSGDQDNEPSPPEESYPSTFVSSDIGTVGHPGSVEWTQDGRNEIRVSGSGNDIWFEEDGFHFMHREITGDGEIIVRVLGQIDTHDFAKAGLMVRETLSSDSRHAAATINPVRRASLIWRQETNGRTQANTIHDQDIPIWLRLQRTGDILAGAYSYDATTWSDLGSVTLDELPESLFVGLAVTSKDNNQINEARFDNLLLLGAGWDQGAPPPSLNDNVLIAQNIGNVRHGGGSQFREADGSITIDGSGTGIRSRSDGFHFLHQHLEGNGAVTVRIDDLTGSPEWARAGIMIRETLDSDSPHAMIVSSPLRSVSFQKRHEQAGFTFDTTTWGRSAPVWLRLARQGNTIIASHSADGTGWQHFDQLEMPMSETVHIGLVYTSGDNNLPGSATFSAASFPNQATRAFTIVPALMRFEPVAIDESISSSPSTVSFASTGGSLNPVGSNLFALYVNRTGKNDAPANIRYEIFGPGSGVIQTGMLPASDTIPANEDSGLIFFEVDPDAYLPYDVPLMIHLTEGEGYRVGAADSVMFTIHSRPIDAWRSRNFTQQELSDPTISGDTATPAGDGVPNLLKYALGHEPMSAIDNTKLPSLHLTANGVALGFERPADRPDIRYIVEASTDLRHWVSGASHIELEIIRLGSTEQVYARDLLPIGEQKQRFMRLRIERR